MVAQVYEKSPVKEWLYVEAINDSGFQGYLLANYYRERGFALAAALEIIRGIERLCEEQKKESFPPEFYRAHMKNILRPFKWEFEKVLQLHMEDPHENLVSRWIEEKVESFYAQEKPAVMQTNLSAS